MSLVVGLGLEHSCHWPREGLSLVGLFLASNFFVSLALATSLAFSTPPLINGTESNVLYCFFANKRICKKKFKVLLY